MLNETNRDVVTADIIAWLDSWRLIRSRVGPHRSG
jgi:hypothetical protein